MTATRKLRCSDTRLSVRFQDMTAIWDMHDLNTLTVEDTTTWQQYMRQQILRMWRFSHDPTHLISEWLSTIALLCCTITQPSRAKTDLKKQTWNRKQDTNRRISFSLCADLADTILSISSERYTISISLLGYQEERRETTKAARYEISVWNLGHEILHTSSVDVLKTLKDKKFELLFQGLCNDPLDLCRGRQDSTMT